MCDADCVQAIYDLRALAQFGVYVLQVAALCLFGLFIHAITRGK